MTKSEVTDLKIDEIDNKGLTEPLFDPKDYTDFDNYEPAPGYEASPIYPQENGEQYQDFGQPQEYSNEENYTYAQGYNEQASYGNPQEFYAQGDYMNQQSYEGVQGYTDSQNYSEEFYSNDSGYAPEQMYANEEPYNEQATAIPSNSYNEVQELNTMDEEEEARERAAARRRKAAARERRRKKRRQQAIIRCSILLLIVILLLVGFVKMISGIAKHIHKSKKAATTTEAISTEATTEEIPIDEAILAQEIPADRESALAKLAEIGATDPTIQNICDNAAVYPDIILRHLAANTELADYAVSYPAKVNNVYDGDFTLDIPSAGVPLYLQFDQEWGYADYGDALLATAGNAPVCVSMAAVYLRKDGTLNPIKVGDSFMAAGYVSEGSKTSEAAFTEGVRAFGLTAEEVQLDADSMKYALDCGKVIVAEVGPGDFTKETSYIVLREYRNGLFFVCDPTSTARSNVGWSYQRLSTQIMKMWAYDTDGSATPSSDDQTTPAGDEPAQAPTGDEPSQEPTGDTPTE